MHKNDGHSLHTVVDQALTTEVWLLNQLQGCRANFEIDIKVYIKQGKEPLQYATEPECSWCHNYISNLSDIAPLLEDDVLLRLYLGFTLY